MSALAVEVQNINLVDARRNRQARQILGQQETNRGGTFQLKGSAVKGDRARRVAG